MSEVLRKPFALLRSDDFFEHPVWVACEGDEDDGGAGGDEGAGGGPPRFTPYHGPVPVDPDDGHFVVRAQATLHDGTWVPACFTPVTSEGDACFMKPHLLVGPAPFDLDELALAPAAERDERCRRVLGKESDEVLPARVAAGAGLVDGVVKCRIAVPATAAEAEAVALAAAGAGVGADAGRTRRRFWSARR